MQFEKFDICQWRERVTLPIDYVPPADADINIFLDSSPTTNPQSDKSAFACGFNNSGIEWVILDMATDRYTHLADTALDLIEKWKPVRFSYENIPGMSWWRELLELKAELRQIKIPPIYPVTPRNTKGAKEHRICSLQQLFDPVAIAFRSANYLSELFEQVENFRIGGDRKGVENGLLDSLAYLTNVSL